MDRRLSPAIDTCIAAAAHQERLANKIARVNDLLITQSEYDKRLAMAMRAPRAPDLQTLRTSVLEDMIRERLLDERAKEMAVTLPLFLGIYELLHSPPAGLTGLGRWLRREFRGALLTGLVTVPFLLLP